MTGCSGSADCVGDRACHVQSQELKNILLINCGSAEDIPRLLQLPESTRAIVLDSHRHAAAELVQEQASLRLYEQAAAPWPQGVGQRALLVRPS